ncbi:hypothetical protein SFRURICE_012306 [Spodoptera frugiperda]|uniref:Lipase n=1 Tax=Spodoptera frugiperda TaxID=7108 RepID=A0A2H1WZN4_SPOFR|nr:hypothetical protein SFRURICE_012306 [Spodoptera frugiperda]
MLRAGLLIIATCVSLAAARRSPNADTVEKWVKDVNVRYSDNVLEDALLDVPDLIRKYRYPVEVHSVTTEDGYILEMHRIPHGRDANNVPGERKPVVFLMHGMLVSSADYVIFGPGRALAYILAEEGYDVWMGNARGNYYSRKHVRLNPDALLSTAFWKFSWEEIGSKDLPAMIDYALAVSGEKGLHYIGHSQGTTSYFVFGAMRPEYNSKIISMHAMAPVAYMAHNQSPILNFISPHANRIESIASLIGIGEFLPSNEFTQQLGSKYCNDDALTQPLCSAVLMIMGGWNIEQHNATMLPVIMGHAPAGISVRQLAHYGQGIAAGHFRRYDQGSRMANYRAYGSFTPPPYDLSKVTAPVFLHYSDNDHLAHVEDVDRLFRELARPTKMRVPMASFSHVDFNYGINAKELVYDRMINLIKAIDDSV